MSERSGGPQSGSLPEPTIEVEPERDSDSVETPAEDAWEQRREAVPSPETERVREVPLDVDPADLAEQAREVGHDDDEYR